MSTILVKENELKALAFNKLTQAGLDAQTAQQVADVWFMPILPAFTPTALFA